MTFLENPEDMWKKAGEYQFTEEDQSQTDSD